MLVKKGSWSRTTPTKLDNYFLTMAYKLLLSCPLIYHAPNHSFLHSRRSHAIITPYGRRQKKGENQLYIRDFTVVPLTIFSIKLLFRGQRATVISQLTERFSPCRRRRPLAFITKDQRHQENGKKRMRVDDVSVILLTIFSIKLLFSWPTRDRDIAAHRPNFAPLPSLPASLHCN
jgi:hypothetical protein